MDASELLVGVDFAGPRRAAQQRRKIIAIAARRVERGVYRIAADGFNARLRLGQPPGWTAQELRTALLDSALVRVVGFDFPFSLPRALLDDPDFGAVAGHLGSFGSWAAFNRFVAANLPLQPPLDLRPFAAWRDTAYWQKRATDGAARAQPALKHTFQVLFNMTLLGNALLASLAASGHYRVIPFTGPGPANEAIEVYPGLTMRALGFPHYKQDPRGAIAVLLAACAAWGVRIDLDDGIRTFCEGYNSAGGGASDPDGSDALIALATAILYREGHCHEVIAPAERQLRDVEGVIWGPSAGAVGSG